MTCRRWEVINTSLSCGQYKLVVQKNEKGETIYKNGQPKFCVDTQAMLGHITNLFNQTSQRLNWPNDRSFSFDESMRPSRVKFDPLRLVKSIYN